MQLGYFAQNQAEYLDGNHLTSNDGRCMQTRTNESARYVGFLFRGDDVDKKVKVLSGGERNRLAM
jgi:ATP-binding cassette subfamily F protein 3